ncbi:PQQ-dependent dehydrogenase, methanol/ethanol family [Kordiimonas pumila]|uniref:PQQ-dependent dehydrogenase, methanol/ethanol family n=1 Tax=Kordiimonas pumila TaxID=2161677 RepID=A0ABV7D7I0_9PROT|nr:PQQ-dependent dehydrogenase, methanol/ethanol family [Kordiimonas pumila]
MKRSFYTRFNCFRTIAVIVFLSLLAVSAFILLRPHPVQYGIPTSEKSYLSPDQNSADWPLHDGPFNSTRYSRLDTLNTESITDLGLAWAFGDYLIRGRVARGNETTPLVINDIMYISGPWSTVYALNAKTGSLIWDYDPNVDGNWMRNTCCDAVNRGVAFANGKVFIGTLDGYLDTLDAATGKLIRRTDTLIDRTRAYSITGAPRIAGNLVVIGNGGAEMGVRGYVTAYDIETGKQAWRFYTVPGDPAKPDENPELAAARKTWATNSRWDIGGGGTVWDSMTYDPDLNLLYIGVGNGSPWPVWLRSPGGGDNLYLSSIVALDASTGRMKWHYQTTPADSWDYTATQNMILADLDINGRARKVIMQAPKNGFFYILDRETGELLSAEKYTHVTWADKIDMATGRPVMNPTANYSQTSQTIWPSTAGGHNWQPMAYSLDTKLVYIPVLELPMTFSQEKQLTYQAATALVGAQASPPRPGTPAAEGVFQSILTAWDPVAQKAVWKSEPRPWWSGGVLTTSGNLVIQGTADGYLIARNAQTGKIIKEIFLGVGIIAAPITYEIDGIQYLAVATGFGGGIKRYLPGVAALEYENKTQLLVFKLAGGDIPIPPRLVPDAIQPLPPMPKVTTETLTKGRDLFMLNCGKCHAFRGAENGYPNLWNMAPHTLEAFDEIVLNGAYAYSGMPQFNDIMSAADTAALRAFIINDQHSVHQSAPQPH